MKRISLLALMFALLCNPLQALDKYIVQAGLYQNYGDFGLSSLNSGLADSSFIMGYQASVLKEQGNLVYPLDTYYYGISYYRLQGSGSTFMLTDGYEAVFEYFYGDKVKVVQKRPFWEKLWYRGGARAGFYNWVITDRGTSAFSETDTGEYYAGYGLTASVYIAVGLGRLGSLEYSYRTMLSSGVSDSVLDHSYLAYVQQWDF